MPPLERPFPAETLRAFRAWLGLSQADVASILGISARSVQTYETDSGPSWMPYALLGWATIFHGVTARVAARKLGLPYEHYPVADEAVDADDLAAFDRPAARDAAHDDASRDEEDDEAAWPPQARTPDERDDGAAPPNTRDE